MNDELTKFLIQIEELESWKEIYKGVNELYNDNILIKTGNEIASNKIIQLQSNWNSLREWLEKNYEESHDIWYVKIINKMNELEGADNENN